MFVCFFEFNRESKATEVLFYFKIYFKQIGMYFKECCFSHSFMIILNLTEADHYYSYILIYNEKWRTAAIFITIWVRHSIYSSWEMVTELIIETLIHTVWFTFYGHTSSFRKKSAFCKMFLSKRKIKDKSNILAEYFCNLCRYDLLWNIVQ